MSPNPEKTADLVTFTEEILDGKLHFLCRDTQMKRRCMIRILLSTQRKIAPLKIVLRKIAPYLNPDPNPNPEGICWR